MNLTRSIAPCLLVAVGLSSGPALAQLPNDSPLHYDPEVVKMRTKLGEAAKCKYDMECVEVARAACPYGCSILANKKKASHVKGLLKKEPKRCEYKCGPDRNTVIVCREGYCRRVRKSSVINDDNRAQHQRKLALRARIRKLRSLVKHRRDFQSRLELLDRKLRTGRGIAEQDEAFLAQLEKTFAPPPPPAKKPKNSKTIIRRRRTVEKK